MSDTKHWPEPSVVQLVVVLSPHTPLTAAPDEAGLMVITTVAFQKFLLTVVLDSVNEATVTVCAWLLTVNDWLVDPVAASSSVTVRVTL